MADEHETDKNNETSEEKQPSGSKKRSKWLDSLIQRLDDDDPITPEEAELEAEPEAASEDLPAFVDEDKAAKQDVEGQRTQGTSPAEEEDSHDKAEIELNEELAEEITELGSGEFQAVGAPPPPPPPTPPLEISHDDPKHIRITEPGDEGGENEDEEDSGELSFEVGGDFDDGPVEAMADAGVAVEAVPETVGEEEQDADKDDDEAVAEDDDEAAAEDDDEAAAEDDGERTIELDAAEDDDDDEQTIELNAVEPTPGIEEDSQPDLSAEIEIEPALSAEIEVEPADGPDDEEVDEVLGASGETLKTEVDAAAEDTAGDTDSQVADDLTLPIDEDEPEPEPEEVVSTLDVAIEQAREDDTDRLVATFSRELEIESDRQRKALLQHELGHIYHKRQENESKAAKAYAQALNLDPLLLPNVWAIGRIFTTRQLWPNLLKLYDAQIRFEEDPAQQAEILLEKGWIQFDKVNDPAGARESFWAAFNANKQWITPLVALEKLCLQQGDVAELARVLQHLSEFVADPERKVAILMDLARLQDQLSDGTPDQALRVLEDARTAGVKTIDVLELMEQIARDGELHNNEVIALERQAELLLGGETSGAADAAARLRQAALVARDRLEDPGRAQKLLERALELVPQEKLLQRDLLAVAEERGEWSQVEAILSSRLVEIEEVTEQAALHYRIGLARLKAKSLTALEAFDQALELLPAYLPVLVEKERRLLERGELEALAELYLAEADAVEQRSPGLPGGETIDARWCASALWRAAAVLHRHVSNPERAIEICRRALALDPGFAPAAEEYEDLLLETGQVEALAEVLETRLSSSDQEVQSAALESLYSLSTGPLDDPDRQLSYLKRLRQLRRDDPGVARRLVAVLYRLDRHEELEQILRDLIELEPDEVQQTAWKLALADLLSGPLERQDAAIEIYQKILEQNPAHTYAFANLDALLVRSGRHEDLAQMLRVAADDVLDEAAKSDLLRRLGSVYVRQLEQPEQAIKAYQELVDLRPDDAVALHELTRAALQADDAEKSIEALERQIEHADADSVKVRRLIAAADLLNDRVGDAARAEELWQKAAELAVEPAEAIDAHEALIRRQIARGDFNEADATLSRLVEEGPTEARATYLGERAWINAGPLGEHQRAAELWHQLQQAEGQKPGSLLGRLRLAAGQRDAAAVGEALSGLASVVEEEGLAAALHTRAGLLAQAAGDSGQTATESLRHALQIDPEATEALLALLAQPGLKPAERASLGLKLAELAPDRVRDDMRLPLASDLEKAGRLRDAAAEVGQILEKDADNLPGLLMLQRLCQAAGDEEREARTWARLAGLLKERGAKAEAYARAAELLQRTGEAQNAGILLRHVLALSPNDEQAFERLRKIYNDGHDQRGLADLLGHRIQNTEDRATLIGLHFERAELRRRQLDDRKGAARDLMRILKLDSTHMEALRQLARLYDEDNNKQRALELYRTYVDAADSISLKRPALIRMAELLKERGRIADAVDACRVFLTEAQDDDRVLELLAELYTALKDYPHAVETLERLGELRSDRQWKAANLHRIGLLYWRDMRDHQEARQAMMRSRDMDPANIEVVGDLRSLNNEMNLQEDSERLLDRAKDDLLEALVRDPLDTRNYKKLMKVSEWAEDVQTLLAAMGVLCFFNEAESQDQDLYRRRMSQNTSFSPKRIPGAHVLTTTLVAPTARSAYGEIWNIISPVVPKVAEGKIATDPGAFGVGKEDRVKRKAGGPVTQTLDRMASLFGLSNYDIYLSSADPDIVEGVATDKPALVVGRSVVASMPRLDATQRFRLGRTLALLRYRSFALEVLGPDELERIFCAAIFAVEPGAALPVPRSEVESLSKRIFKALPRKQRKVLQDTVPLAVERFKTEVGDMREWVSGVLLTVNRAGLLVCGDILIALEQVVEELRTPFSKARKTPEQITTILQKNRAAEDLLVYSVSNDYINLRQELQV